MVDIPFSTQIKKRKRQFVNATTRHTKQAAKASLKVFVNETPVDKGVARSNWRVGLNRKATAVIPAYTPYPSGSRANGQGKSERANANAAIQAGRARINSVRGVPGVGLTTAIIISNNAPYIAEINKKSSSTGFIEKGIKVASDRLSGARIFTDENGNKD